VIQGSLLRVMRKVPRSKYYCAGAILSFCRLT
jgi:hypothetical protein